MNDSTDKPMSDGAEAAVVRKNRTQMIVMLAVAMISLGGSYLLFYLAQGTEGWGTTNNGAWVEPPTTIADLEWRVEGDERVWWLWTVNAGCDMACQASAKNLRALHILLNREADRVRRGYTDLSGASDMTWMNDFPELNEVSIATSVEPGIYIIDPLGNLVDIAKRRAEAAISPHASEFASSRPTDAWHQYSAFHAHIQHPCGQRCADYRSTENFGRGYRKPADAGCRQRGRNSGTRRRLYQPVAGGQQTVPADDDSPGFER